MSPWKLHSLASILVLAGASGCSGSTAADSNQADPDSGDPGSDDGGGTSPDAGEDAGGPSVQAVPLSSCVPTVYTAPTTIGGSEVFQLLLDTGSTSLGVAGKGCSCGGVTPVYTPGSSAIDEKQSAQSQFGIGSWSGEIYQDSVAVGSSSAVPTKLVDISQESNFFHPIQCDSQSGGTQGVLGFGPAASAVAGTNGFFDQYVNTSNVPDVFAVQLCETTGTLWLGGFDPSATVGPPQYTPLAADLSSQYYYSVNLASVSVGGVTVSVTTGAQLPDSVVDTGTSAFLLNSTAFNALATAIQSDASFKQVFGSSFFPPSNSQNLSCVAVNQTKAELDASLPALTLNFGPTGSGISVKAVATESYLFTYNNQWCAALLGVDQSSLGPLAGIIGSPVLRSSVVIFDRAQKRIGFAPHAACN
jgi:Eukaryotic aspartyl protease